MKSARGFAVAMVVLFAAMMTIEFVKPKHFQWRQTYAHADDQPFGCALFDSVMAASLPQGYTTTSLTLTQLEKAIPAHERHVYLIVVDSRPFSKTDEWAILHMMERGDQFIVAANYSWRTDTLESILNIETGYSWTFSTYWLKEETTTRDFDTLTWAASIPEYPPRQWLVPNSLLSGPEVSSEKGVIEPLLVRSHYYAYSEEDSAEQVRVFSDDEPVKQDEVVFLSVDTIAGLITHGKGKMIAASNVAMFSNYGIVKCDAASLTLRLLSQLERYPIIRLDPAANTEAGGISESPLRYVLEQPPMHRAVWLLLVTVILAMVFTARRRQRVIPVIKQPVNRSLEMVKHIGSLYYHRHDNADLLTKKYSFFVEEVRRLTMVDLDDENHIEDAYLQLQHASGISRDELRERLQDIVGRTAESPTDKTLMHCIDYLNYVLTKLKS